MKTKDTEDTEDTKEIELNRDVELRSKILGLSGEYSGGCESFEIGVAQLKELFDNNFIEPLSRHNDAPENEEILGFMEAYPDFKAGGYAVSPERHDYRVSIDRIVLDRKPTPDEMIEFTQMCRYADEFQCDLTGCFAWFD